MLQYVMTQKEKLDEMLEEVISMETEVMAKLDELNRSSVSDRRVLRKENEPLNKLKYELGSIRRTLNDSTMELEVVTRVMRQKQENK